MRPSKRARRSVPLLCLAGVAALGSGAGFLGCGETGGDAHDGSSRGGPSAPSSRNDGADGEAAPTIQHGLYAEYFDSYHDKVLERVEATVDHDWGEKSPGKDVGADAFSVRWTGTLTPDQSGSYTIAIDADDGTRLWIDGELVISDWEGHSSTERHEATVDLVAGKAVSIRLDYFEYDQTASVKLSWSSDSLPEEILPTERLTTRGAPSGSPAPKPPYTNPVIGFDCPDPGVLGTGTGEAAVYYVVCTGGSFPIRTSRDLVYWEDTGASILPQGKPSWAANGGRNWAPELHQVGNETVAYYTTVNDDNTLAIGAASAPKPTGPFTDRGSPIVVYREGVIDPTYFQDDDGTRWLIVKLDGNSVGHSTPIQMTQLEDDGISLVDGAFTTLITNDPSTWEGGVVEAPWIVKRNGYYYLFYSGNVYDHRYRTGVARAKSLTGPWEKHGAPILANNAAWVGPGHGSVVHVGNFDYYVYHAWENAGDGTNGAGRFVMVDKITWADGWPQIAEGTPSTDPQPWPGEAN